MTDATNPRARLDVALEEMRSTMGSSSQPVRLTAEATVACAEALSLLVDAQVAATGAKPEPAPAEPEPGPDPLESLPSDTPVGHGWVADRWDLFKPDGDRFTWWLKGKRRWAVPSASWGESDLPGTRPATVGDLRRMGVPVSEWPDIEEPEPEQSVSRAIAERDNAIAALRSIRNELAKLAVGYFAEGDDARSAYRESMQVVDGEARRRGLDLEAP